MIEAARSNSGDMYVSVSEALAATINSSTISVGAGPFILGPDNYGALDGVINLRELWFDGQVAGDGIVVWYILAQRKSTGID